MLWSILRFTYLKWSKLHIVIRFSRMCSPFSPNKLWMEYWLTWLKKVSAISSKLQSPPSRLPLEEIFSKGFLWRRIMIILLALIRMRVDSLDSSNFPIPAKPMLPTLPGDVTILCDWNLCPGRNNNKQIIY